MKRMSDRKCILNLVLMFLLGINFSVLPQKILDKVGSELTKGTITYKVTDFYFTKSFLGERSEGYFLLVEIQFTSITEVNCWDTQKNTDFSPRTIYPCYINGISIKDGEVYYNLYDVCNDYPLLMSITSKKEFTFPKVLKPKIPYKVKMIFEVSSPKNKYTLNFVANNNEIVKIILMK